MNASTNEVTIASGRYRSYPDPLTPPSADTPADVTLPTLVVTPERAVVPSFWRTPAAFTSWERGR